MKPEQLAERLRNVYIKELTRSVKTPGQQTLHSIHAQVMLRHAYTGDPILYEEPDEKTWIWSDLHLGHDSSIGAFGRPFHNAWTADKAMHRAWLERVGHDDAIICLGDVSVDACLRSHHIFRWRQSPGFKVLVLGNHDVDPINQVKRLDIQRTALALAAPGDPPLLLTHVPLIQVPHGTVNVHGHIHDKAPPTPNRHINVSVEQLGYAPANLKDIRRLARRMLEGRRMPTGKSTRALLDLVEATMP